MVLYMYITSSLNNILFLFLLVLNFNYVNEVAKINNVTDSVLQMETNENDRIFIILFNCVILSVYILSAYILSYILPDYYNVARAYLKHILISFHLWLFPVIICTTNYL